jgi:transcriptional regulator
MDIDRRKLLMTLVAGPALLEQERAAPDPSLYIPKAHLVDDRRFLHDFMDEFAFVDLVTTTPTLRITHIPVVLERNEGRYGTIYGHIAAQNPQQATFDGAHDAAIVFRGPHGYISPTWYSRRDVAPTWNFAVVHASGRPTAIAGPAGARDVLARLIRRYEEAVGSSFTLDRLQPEYVDNLLPRIAPFRLRIEALEGKFKLGQERSAEDKQGVLAHLREGAYRERTLYELTDAFYRRG